MDIFDFDKKQVFTEILEKCRKRYERKETFSICGVIMENDVVNTKQLNIVAFMYKHKPSVYFIPESYNRQHILDESEFWWPLEDGLSRILYLERLLAFIEHGEQTNSIQ